MRDLSEYFKKNYAYEWYAYGLESKKDDIIKFAIHWIAFNWLYGDYGGRDERESIKAFCNSNEEVLSSFDAFSKPEIKLFLEQPVYDARGHCRKRSEEIYEKVTKGSGIEQITNLLLTFYQVRCNLFHGQKILRCERDIALVENSSVLLQGYLDAILNSNKKTRFYL